MNLDVRDILSGTIGKGISPRFTRTGRLKWVIGTAHTIREWGPIFRQNRIAIAVYGALHRARLAGCVDVLRSTDENTLEVRLAAGLDDEIAAEVLRLIDTTWNRAMLAKSRDPVLH